MIDIHTHLYFPDYDADREDVVKRAFEAGITRMISVGTEPSDWMEALSIAEYDERVRGAVGIHPHWFNEQSEGGTFDDVIQKLKNTLLENQEKIVAIGECGLDYFSRNGDEIPTKQREFQKQGFIAQIRLAREHGLPMILHTRPSLGTMDTYEDMLSILKSESPQWPEGKFVLHCYVGDTVITQSFLGLPQVFFSFTGNITYPTKRHLQATKDDLAETVKCIPLDRLLTETDCPFLAPQLHRGGRNEPSYVSEVAMKIAEIKNVSIGEVVVQTERNAKTLFG